MRLKRIRRRSVLKTGQIDMAPMIDVVFLLLIFFMLTSNFILQPGIKVRLPRAVTSEVIGSDNLIITITAQDLLFLNEKPIQIGPLNDRLKEAARRKENVLIKADTSSSLGRVVEIWDMARELGIDHVNIASNRREPVI